MSPAREAALAYVDAVNAADLGALVALFAPDAVVRNPLGTFEGRSAIEGFYGSVVLAGQAQVTAGRVLDDGSTSVLEMSATSPLAEPDQEPARALDLFTVDDAGLIATLDIYYR